MSLQFVFGNSGAGKSHYVYEHIVQESVKHPQQNYLVLVPEQFTMQTQKDLCTAHPRHGIMNIDVLSFVRLAHRVFEETGRETKRVLDDEGKSLILRKIAGVCEQELKVLKGNLKRQGYISEVKSVISEFTQYGIGFEELDEFLDTLEQESYLAYKLRDIRRVYEDFEEYLADRYITKEELLDVLSDAVPESELLKDSVVVLDGFTGFTPVQNRLLGELLKVCKRVVVTVVMDSREDPFSYQHPYQLFAISKQMVTSLVRVAGEYKVAVEDPVCLYEKPVARFLENPMLGFLESELFRYSGRRYEDAGSAAAYRAVEEDPAGSAAVYRAVAEDPAGSAAVCETAAQRPADHAISLHAARNPKEEAGFVASEIRRLVREEGYRYRDVAVIASDMNTYANHLEKQCAAYGIPIFMDHKKSILLNAFVEYVRSLLAMAEQNFTYESVFRFLRTGMSGFTRDEVDRMENYVLALGLKGYKKWQAAWVRRTSGVAEEELAELNHLRVRFVEKVDGLVMILKKRSKTVRDVTLAVYEFFRQEQMQEQIQAMELRFQKEGELTLAKEYSQIYRIVIELFDKFVELLGEEKISLKEYCELLDAGLEEAKVGVIPPGLDQVVIGDMERTRLNHLKVLFFLGANDVFLPGSLGQGGLLSERDRERFAEQKLALSPGAKEKTYVQKFYLYMNLTKPSARLAVSFSKTSADGKALRPAYLVQDLQRLFPQISVHDEEGKRLEERELTQSGGAQYLAAGLRERRSGLGSEWKELYTWYARGAEGAEVSEGEGAAAAQNRQPDAAFFGKEQKLLPDAAFFGKEQKLLLDAAFYRKQPDRLAKETAEELFGDLSRAGVTRLERFASCAYAHFLDYGLRLSERQEYRFESMDLGNIAHQSMERFAKKADERRTDWTELSEETRSALIEESVEESIVDYGNTVLYSTARNEYMISRIKKLIHRSVWALTKQMEQGDFRPSGYEMKFGGGKIDRIDTCEDDGAVYVKVTDYKTGMKSFDITAFWHGLQLQLPVYLNAALQMEQKKAQKTSPGKEIIPAGVFYYRMQDPIVEKEKDDQMLEKKLLKELKLDGLVNADEAVLHHLERNLSGTSNLIPVGRNKDGSLSKNSKTLEPGAFAGFLEHTKKKTDELKAEMAEGYVSAEPYELGNSTGCDYCPYGDICGFDTRLDGYGYRKLKKYSREEILEKLENVSPGAEKMAAPGESSQKNEKEQIDGRTVDGGTTESH